MSPADAFADPLLDLGAQDPRLRGILGVDDPARTLPPGVTAQFLDNAGEYHRRYFDTGYWSLVLAQALEAVGGPLSPRTILDIGSGSGNSVIPLADRFPEARIVATDVSAPLLAILRDFLESRRDRTRFTLVCVDACRARYARGFADLAVGAAILHHLPEPERALAACFDALAPGGWAVFFEPFESGNLLLKLCYQRIHERASPEERETPGMKMLHRVVDDLQVRSRPRSDPVFAELDDKWMFTRTYFERIRREQGWGEVATHPLHVHRDGLRRQAAVHLRLGADLAPDALPEWAWSMLDEADAEMSDDLRAEFPQEAAILLRKPG